MEIGNIQPVAKIEDVIVSVICLTYNHERYIAEALESIIKQISPYKFELIVADDSSTDQTSEIISDYAKRYPDLILYKRNNHNIGMSKNAYQAMRFARGKYVAFCEGDDYWTDCQKLSKQVSFLIRNQQYSFVVSNFIKLQADAGGHILTFLGNDEVNEDFAIDMRSFFKSWRTKTVTLLYDANCLNLDVMSRYHLFRDFHIIYHLIRCRPGYYMNQVMAAYRIHVGGCWSLLDYKKKLLQEYKVLHELCTFNHEKYVKRYYVRCSLKCIIYRVRDKDITLIKLFIENANEFIMPINMLDLIYYSWRGIIKIMFDRIKVN